MVSPPKRARSDTDKQARREHLLATARELWRERGFATLTMSEVASRAGLAKGTTYLYFQTKEELLLALLTEELEAWFAELNAHLETAGTLEPAQVARAVAAGFASRDTLKRLVTIQAVILEHNIGEAAALEFKRFLLHHATRTGTLLERRLRFLRQGDGMTLLQRVNALVIGFGQLSDPSEQIAAFLERDDLRPLRVDFASQLESTLLDILRGMATKSAAERKHR